MDCNINLHRLSDGVFVGQFNKPENPGKSTKCWNIHDMSKYAHRRPRYVREWYLKLKKKFKPLKPKTDEEAEQDASKPDHGGSAEKAKRDTMSDPNVVYGSGPAMKALAEAEGKIFKQIDATYEEDPTMQDDMEEVNDLQEDYYRELAKDMNFSESEDEDDKHLIKNAAQYLNFKPQTEGSKKNEVNMNRYFDHFQN